jgi:Pectate lyase superfamily protein
VSVVQISRIQVRRGQTSITGIPQLASGEFGWSVDQQQLYIGNGSVYEGAPAVGNTRILTEHDSNIFSFTNANYTYGNGTLVQTGPNSNPNIVRTPQAKLDDTVNLRDFGATGGGIIPDTSAIQRAITYSAAKGKALIFPEGKYLVTATVYLPPYAEIRGAGMNKTTLIAATTASIFQTVGLDINKNILLDPSVAVTKPKNIVIDGVSFTSSLTNSDSMLKLNSITDSAISSCVFVANSGQASTSTMASAIQFINSGSLLCRGISIRHNIFQNLASAISCDYDIKTLDISSNQFKNIDSGAIFMKTPASGNSIGPTHVDIHDNSFYNINNQAIYVGSTGTTQSSVKSRGNSYVNVGIGYNNTNGDLSQISEILTFSNFNNSSVDDSFSRLYAINTGSISQFSNIMPIVSGPVTLSSCFYQSPISIASTTTASIFVWPTNTYVINGVPSAGQNVILDYIFTTLTDTRQGQLTMTVSTGTTLISDKFSTTSDTGLIFTVDSSRSDVSVINAFSPMAGTLSYSLTVRQ